MVWNLVKITFGLSVQSQPCTAGAEVELSLYGYTVISMYVLRTLRFQHTILSAVKMHKNYHFASPESGLLPNGKVRPVFFRHQRAFQVLEARGIALSGDTLTGDDVTGFALVAFQVCRTSYNGKVYILRSWIYKITTSFIEIRLKEYLKEEHLSYFLQENELNKNIG